MKKNYFLLLSFILTVCCFTACIKDNFDFDKWDREVKYDANFAIPIAFGDLSYAEVEKMSGGINHIVADENGFLSLVYNTTIESDDVQKKYKFKAQSTNSLLNFSNISSPTIANPINTSVNWTFSSDFNPNARIKKVKVKEGDCQITVKTNDVSYTGTITGYITFPTIKSENGEALSFQFTNKNINTTESNLTTDPISLNKYIIEFSPNSNTVPIEIHVDFFNNVIPTDIDFQVEITGPSDNSDGKGGGLTYKEAWGYFGIDALLYKNDSIDITIFKDGKYEIERYWFEDPKIWVNYTNSYCIPSDFQFVSLRAFNNSNTELLPLISMLGTPNFINPNWGTIDYPLYPQRYKEGSFVVNKENSNFMNIVPQKPRWLKFSAEVRTNMNTTTAEINAMNDYITDTSKLKTNIKVEFPLWGDLYKFTYKDTNDFKLPEILTKYDPLKKASIRIDITNGFPAEMIGQIYFLNESNAIIDSLLSVENQMVLKAADIGANDIVNQPSRKITYVTVTSDQIDKWKDVKKIMYKAYANTTNVNPAVQQQLVKVYDTYRVKFNLGLSFDVAIEGNVDSIINSIDNSIDSLK